VHPVEGKTISDLLAHTSDRSAVIRWKPGTTTDTAD
jgi:hypothetical protein